MNGYSGLEGGKWREASVRRFLGWSRRGRGWLELRGWQVERTRWIQDLLEVEATDLGDGTEMKVKVVSCGRERGHSSSPAREELSSKLVGVQCWMCCVWGGRSQEILKWREQVGREKKLAVMESQHKSAH